MGDPRRNFEIRCPIYGFIRLNDLEWDIINHSAFQRLRRIRQLGWTDYVYPGATHSRFEHSLGVMHMATLLYDGIVQRSQDILKSELGYDKVGLKRHKVLVRLAALLHDVGHAPFSHASEELFPLQKGGSARYKHEDYSAKIVRHHFKDVIENNEFNKTNYNIRAEDVANLLEGSGEAGSAALWRDLIVGQVDADRMDYLLRDSLHAGVDYGRFDWHRLIYTVVVVTGLEEGEPRIGVTEGGWHAAEGLILARYLMFTQVYFHKTRVAFDHHLQRALAEMLPDGVFPSPEVEDLDHYLEWNDWRVLGRLAKGEGGEHGQRLATRNHYREVAHTHDTPIVADLQKLDRWRKALGSLLAAEERAESSWYKIGSADIPVASETQERRIRFLSEYSSVVKNLRSIRKVLLFVRQEDVKEAKRRLDKIGGENDE